MAYNQQYASQTGSPIQLSEIMNEILSMAFHQFYWKSHVNAEGDHTYK
jgi:hypothetical protein